MSIKAVLFDLDGTLLPMDQDVFVKAYFGGIAKKLAPYGYDQSALVGAILAGTMRMIENDGTVSNEQTFWRFFSEQYGQKALADIPLFNRYYEEDFDKLCAVCGRNPQAAEAVRAVKKAGLRVALATNPIFPSVATEKRIRWAGLSPQDFELFTTYENSKFCKPNLGYYKEITDKLGVSPCKCLMVGNDTGDDMVAKKLGMKVFLLTDCLINKAEEDISNYKNGGFDKLLEYINELTEGK